MPFFLLSPIFCSASKLSPLDRVWVTSYEFLKSQGDLVHLELLKSRFLDVGPTNFNLAKDFINDQITQKDRSKLNQIVLNLHTSFDCKVIAKKSTENRATEIRATDEFCQNLKELWKKRLNNLQFFEETAGKLEKARLFLKDSKCQEAASLLTEVERREGIFLDLIESLKKSAICLKNQIELERLDNAQRLLEI